MQILVCQDGVTL